MEGQRRFLRITHSKTKPCLICSFAATVKKLSTTRQALELGLRVAQSSDDGERD